MAPALLVKDHKIPTRSVGELGWRSTLRYRALTQVCEQIRTEYRPIWLRRSCFHMEFPTVPQFINTYYHKAADYQNAPKRLLISWDHGKIIDDSEADDEDEEESCQDGLTNITLLVRLRAHCLTFTAKFVSRRILEDDLPNLSCQDCGHSIHCGCDNGYYHEDAYEAARLRMEGLYLYLQVLNNFLTNSNENWLKMFRDTTHIVTLVEFTFDIFAQRPTIYIRFSRGRAPKAFQLKNMYKFALSFLHRSGMMDLKEYDALDYVIGEATDKYTHHAGQCDFQVHTYNQIYLEASHIVEWKAKKESEASVS